MDLTVLPCTNELAGIKAAIVVLWVVVERAGPRARLISCKHQLHAGIADIMTVIGIFNLNRVFLQAFQLLLNAELAALWNAVLVRI